MYMYLLNEPSLLLFREQMQEEYKQIEIIRNIKNSAPFTDCKTEIDNKDNTKDLNFVISMYNLIKYSDNYSLTTGRS